MARGGRTFLVRACLYQRHLAHFTVMGRVILVGVSTVMAFIVVGCGGNTTGTTGSGGPASSGGASGAGGSGGAPECTTASDCSYPLDCFPCADGIDTCPTGVNCINGQCVTTYRHECGVSSGGSVGSGGSGGSTGGTGGGTSPGKASVEFTVTGGPYCMASCPYQSIGIADPSGKSVALMRNCSDVSCGTCVGSPCPLIACPNVGINVTGATLDWDGSYYVTSTCGSGTSCVEPVFAKPGKYTATFCVTPGTLTGPDGGVQQCVNTGPEGCGSVQFDFPSSTVVKGTVGP